MTAVAMLTLGAGAHAGLFGDEKVEQIPVEPLPSVTLQYQAFGPDHTAISGPALVAALVREMVKNTKTTVSARVDGGFEFSSRLEGKVAPQSSTLVFTYVNRRTMLSNRSFIGQALVIPVKYQVQEGADAVEITLTVGETAELQTSSVVLYATPGLRREAVFKDFANLLAGTPQMRLAFTEAVKGEATSSFKPDAVLGNFERLMGKFSSGIVSTRDPMKSEGSYAFLAGATRVPVKVQAYPYRDGTKVVYEANLPYVLRGDQSAEGMDQAAKLRATIDKVLSD